MPSKGQLLLTLMLLSATLVAQQDPIRVLSISGGGARGAWGGGVIQALAEEHGRHYNHVIGTSTGSLLAPFVVGEQYEDLKEYYTGVRQKDIFNVNPFKKGKAEVKGLMAFFRVLLGKKTLGESKNLRKLVRRSLPMETYQQILDKGTFYATAIDFSTGDTYYHSSANYDPKSLSTPQPDDLKAIKRLETAKNALREEMLDWIWVSGNQPVFMSLHATKRQPKAKEKDYWVDGGVRENIPMLKGLQLIVDQRPSGVDTLDIIVNNGKASDIKPLSKARVIQSLLQTIEIFQYDVRTNDVAAASEGDIGQQDHKHGIYSMVKQMHNEHETVVDEDHIHIYIYFMKADTKAILPNNLLFDKDKMTKLWDRGLDYKETAHIEHYVITKAEAQRIVTPFRDEMNRQYRQRPINQ